VEKNAAYNAKLYRACVLAPDQTKLYFPTWFSRFEPGIFRPPERTIDQERGRLVGASMVGGFWARKCPRTLMACETPRN
jgi:hypothetical protein